MGHARRTFTLIASLMLTLTLGLVLTAPPASAGGGGLAGLWMLDEGSGQAAYDLSMSGNRGELGSTPGVDVHDPEWIPLPRVLWFKRAALRFSGSQRVRVANSPSLEPDGVTVVARVRSTQARPFRYVASKGAYSCERASYGLYTGSAGGLLFYVNNGSAATFSADAGPGVWDGRWHTILGTFDGSRVRLMVDGQQVGAATSADVDIAYGLPDSGDFFLGDYAGPCGSPLGFIGDMDSAAVIGHYAPNMSLRR